MTVNPMAISPKLSFLPPEEFGAGMSVHEVQFNSVGTVIPFKSSYFVIQPGCQSPVDTHSVHEIWMLAQGEGELIYDDESSPLRPLDFIYLEPPKKHEVRNTGKEPLIIFSVWWK
ncbi:MAG: cupin domain-containing protein [Candidatus Angelobacter sp. Gp1-AA117]|nr:MAG: cupin domain-containing protein [Candidatus Angelobacter sp. Gp1-AA117]